MINIAVKVRGLLWNFKRRWYTFIVTTAVTISTTIIAAAIATSTYKL